MPPERPALSIVMPAYNEAHRLRPTIERIDAYAGGFSGAIELLVVDDGSTDGTADIARQVEPVNLTLRLLTEAANHGKGYAVRKGMLAAEGQAVLLSDTDLSTPIEQVEKLLPWLERGYGVAIGSRDMPDSVLDPPQPLLRRCLNLVFRTVRGLLMLRDIHDSQCGFKLFTREAAQDVFTDLQTRGFAFDCEALALARRHGYRIKEIGVVWRNDPRSTVQPLRHSLQILRDLIRIRRRLGSAPPA